jgi:hypothetical protein
VWAAVSQLLDHKISLLFPYYAIEEGNFRNADGSFDHKRGNLKAALVTFGGAAVAFVGTWLMIGFAGNPEQSRLIGSLLAAGGLMAVIGTYRYLDAYKRNQKLMRNNREQQIAWRKDMRQSSDAALPYYKVTIERAGFYAPKWLPWMTVAASSEAEARALLEPKLQEWLAIPETELKKIWVDTTYHPNK